MSERRPKALANPWFAEDFGILAGSLRSCASVYPPPPRMPRSHAKAAVQEQAPNGCQKPSTRAKKPTTTNNRRAYIRRSHVINVVVSSNGAWGQARRRH